MAGYSSINVDELRGLIEKHDRALREKANELRALAQKVLKAARELGESWSGSCMGRHNALYYRDFNKSDMHHRFNVEWGCQMGVPDGWHERDPEEVKKRIEQMGGVSIDALVKEDEELAKSSANVRDELTLDLSPLDTLTGFAKEKDLLRQIEKLEFGNDPLKKYVADAINSCPKMTRDFAAINEGRRVPAHSYHEGIAIQTIHHLEATEELWKQSNRLLRRLETIVPEHAVTPTLEQEKTSTRSPTNITNVYHLHGTNARVNIRSTDQSLDVSSVTTEQLFIGLRKHIEGNVSDEEERVELLARLDELEQARENKTFVGRYQEFIAAAANHMTLIAPFIPALTQLLARYAS